MTIVSRWKAFARRAAAAQSAVVLWVLYYVLLVPIAMVRSIVNPRKHDGAAARWHSRPKHTADLPSARRQF